MIAGAQKGERRPTMPSLKVAQALAIHPTDLTRFAPAVRAGSRPDAHRVAPETIRLAW